MPPGGLTVKNFGLIVIFSFLLLAGIFLLLRIGPLAETPGMRGVSEPLATEDSASRRPASAPAGTAGRQSAALPGQPGGASPLPEAAAGSPQNQAAVTPARQFPQAADVPSGTERSKIETLFGPPNMRTVSVDQGRQIETLVYLRTDPNVATFLLLRAGRVISATTTSY
jgi:hypothetical protein